MKIKNGFALRQIVDSWVVLPLAAESVNFSGMLTLNDSGAFLWKILEHGGDAESMVAALTKEYDVSLQEAKADVDTFIHKLADVGCIEM